MVGQKAEVMMDLNHRLAGKIAVVTAAGQGIGRAVAERLLAEGAQVFASDLSAEPLATLEGAEKAVLDATDTTAVAAYFMQFQRVDVLVHAVGYVHQGTIEECRPEDWRRSMAITLDSAFYVLGAAIPKMKAQGGSIITIASVASSTKGFARRAAYGAAKAGVIGLTKAVAADYLHHKIRCNAVCPGTVDSPSLRQRIIDLGQTVGGVAAAEQMFLGRQPTGRFGTPQEIAGICAFLASEDGVFMTGQVVNVDGGITI
jgi:2-keto-3-deoxy-L-fuconate dehydrogenase